MSLVQPPPPPTGLSTNRHMTELRYRVYMFTMPTTLQRSRGLVGYGAGLTHQKSAVRTRPRTKENFFASISLIVHLHVALFFSMIANCRRRAILCGRGPKGRHCTFSWSSWLWRWSNTPEVGGSNPSENKLPPPLWTVTVDSRRCFFGPFLKERDEAGEGQGGSRRRSIFFLLSLAGCTFPLILVVTTTTTATTMALAAARAALPRIALRSASTTAARAAGLREVRAELLRAEGNKASLLSLSLSFF